MFRSLAILLFAAVTMSAGQDRSELRVTPTVPIEGRPVSISYRPASSFIPSPGESVVVEILAAGPSPRVHDVTVRRVRGSFTATWTPPEGTEALVFRAAVGDRVDDRNGEGWSALVSSSNGAPPPRAKTWLARAAAPGGLFGFRARADSALAGAPEDTEPPLTSEEIDWRTAVSRRDPIDRWNALSEYLAAYPDVSEEAKVQVLVRSAIAARAWDAADELIHRQPRKEPLWLIALAEGLMKAEVTLDRASVLAKESVNAARNWDPARRPALLSLREFRNQRASEVPLALRAYARSLVKLGYPAMAEKVYAELNEVLGGNDSDVRNEYAAVRRSLGKDPHPKEPERTSHR